MLDTPQHPVKTSKNEIYRILSKEAEWVSGEHISQLLGVTRAAVAKQVAVLRKEGHAIKAAQKRVQAGGFRQRSGPGGGEKQPWRNFF